jgi:hypothetical protein
VEGFQVGEHLVPLESAISDVGCWTWWTANLPAAFQVEFGGVQIWNPPRGGGLPPSSQVALRFYNPRLVYFLTMADGVPIDWPDQLQRDELEPPSVGYDAFTLTAVELCCRLVDRAVAVRPLVGEPGVTPPPMAGEALLGFEAGQFGLVVAAETLGVFNRNGELDPGLPLCSALSRFTRQENSTTAVAHEIACLRRRRCMGTAAEFAIGILPAGS